MMRWQWHQLDHTGTQIICTSPQTGNHACTSSLKFFYRLAIYNGYKMVVFNFPKSFVKKSKQYVSEYSTYVIH